MDLNCEPGRLQLSLWPIPIVLFHCVSFFNKCPHPACLAPLWPVCSPMPFLALLCAAGGCVLVAQCAVSCVGDSGMKISTSCVTPAQPWTMTHPADSTCCWLTWSTRTRSSSNAPWPVSRMRTGLYPGKEKCLQHGALCLELGSFATLFRWWKHYNIFVFMHNKSFHATLIKHIFYDSICKNVYFCKHWKMFNLIWFWIWMRFLLRFGIRSAAEM